MADQSLLSAAVLGIVEGLTEFIPVSSTGHLLLLGHFIGFESAGKTFEVVIQLGAVLAVLSVYSAKLWQVFSTARTDPKAFRFIIAVALAFLPAVVVGVLAHDFIKRVLFETPMLVAINLIWGGAVLLWVDRMKLEPRYEDAMDVPLGVALKIGLFQCLAMIPGVSRSGSTIVGGLLMGVGKRGAAEFSFFLSMPTMGAAFAYDLWKSRHMLDSSAMTEIAVGFVLALISAILVVKWLLGYVSRHGYALFGWWRIMLGAVTLTALSLGF